MGKHMVSLHPQAKIYESLTRSVLTGELASRLAANTSRPLECGSHKSEGYIKYTTCGNIRMSNISCPPAVS